MSVLYVYSTGSSSFFVSYNRQRFLFRAPQVSSSRRIPPPRVISQIPRQQMQTRRQGRQEEERPPEYTEIATTSFIENASDTDVLIEPPPYVP